jgi:hypothetical protein
MKKMLIAIGFCLLGAAPRAHAGTREADATLIITKADASGEAFGALGSARNSSDTNQYIGCDVAAFSGSGSSVHCFARDASGNGAGCSSSDPALVQSVSSLNSDSFLHFAFSPSATCTSIRVYTYSAQEPKR